MTITAKQARSISLNNKDAFFVINTIVDKIYNEIQRSANDGAFDAFYTCDVFNNRNDIDEQIIINVVDKLKKGGFEVELTTRWDIKGVYVKW